MGRDVAGQIILDVLQLLAASSLVAVGLSAEEMEMDDEHYAKRFIYIYLYSLNPAIKCRHVGTRDSLNAPDVHAFEVYLRKKKENTASLSQPAERARGLHTVELLRCGAASVSFVNPPRVCIIKCFPIERARNRGACADDTLMLSASTTRTSSSVACVVMQFKGLAGGRSRAFPSTSTN